MIHNEKNVFKDYRGGVELKDTLTCDYITAGDYTYYAGYYEGHPFEDCVLYLDAEDNSKPAALVDRLIIGKFCSLASGVQFMMGGTQAHNTTWISNFPMDVLEDDFDQFESAPPKAFQKKGDTRIRNDVWIGKSALIMQGVTIGNGAIIGARAVVTKDVGPYEIWAGNPARCIRKRFTDHEIQWLQELAWWDWPIDKIKRHIPYLRSGNVAGLYATVQKECDNTFRF